jgi:hypothetical protein
MYVFAEIARTFNVAARTKTTVNSVLHIGTPPFPRQLNLKAAPQLEQNYGTHLDTRVAQIAGKKMLI